MSICVLFYSLYFLKPCPTGKTANLSQKFEVKKWLFILRINKAHKQIAMATLMFIGPCIIVIVEEWKINLMSLAILFHFLCAQHVSDINISIIRNLRLCCWITTSVVLFSFRKIANDIKLVFHSSTITMMHSPINIRFLIGISILWRTLLFAGNVVPSERLCVNVFKILDHF